MSESIKKRDLSEQDIITKYVLPAIERAGWDVAFQVRQELSLTAGGDDFSNEASVLASADFSS
jgi:type I site-specific restriction endonuclease